MITIRDVAREAGVPAPTVARILRGGNKEVWQGASERAEKVRRAAERLGYRPNTSARAVRTGRSGTVALLLSTARNRSVLFADLLDGIQAELSARGMRLTVASIPDEKLDTPGFVPKVLQEWSADGLLVNYYQEFPKRMNQLIRRDRIPSVWMNSRQDADCVHPDDAGAARVATEELVSLGHRRIAYLRMARAAGGHYSMRDREKGYRAAMKRAGLKAQVCELDDIWGGEDVRVRQCVELLRRRERPTAVVAYEMASAGPLMHAAGRQKLDVPRDLSVVTFHTDPVRDHGVPLKVMRVPLFEVGKRATAMLMDKLDRPRRRVPARAVPYTKGEGVIAPPTGARRGNG